LTSTGAAFADIIDKLFHVVAPRLLGDHNVMTYFTRGTANPTPLADTEPAVLMNDGQLMVETTGLKWAAVRLAS